MSGRVVLTAGTNNDTMMVSCGGWGASYFPFTNANRALLFMHLPLIGANPLNYQILLSNVLDYWCLL